MKEKGFIHLIILIFVLIFAGILIYLTNKISKFGATNEKTAVPTSSPNSTILQTTKPTSTSVEYIDNTPTPDPTPNIIETYKININDKVWTHLSSKKLGLSFDYPFTNTGYLEFNYIDYLSYKDPSGQIYEWVFTITDPPSESWTYTIVGGVSKDFSIGRETWFTDTYQLSDNDYLDKNNIKLYKTKYGTDAILKKVPVMQAFDEPNDNLIIANLPLKDKRFKAIGIYIKSGISTEEASRLINSITLE